MIVYGTWATIEVSIAIFRLHSTVPKYDWATEVFDGFPACWKSFKFHSQVVQFIVETQPNIATRWVVVALESSELSVTMNRVTTC